MVTGAICLLYDQNDLFLVMGLWGDMSTGTGARGREQGDGSVGTVAWEQERGDGSVGTGAWGGSMGTGAWERERGDGAWERHCGNGTMGTAPFLQKYFYIV